MRISSEVTGATWRCPAKPDGVKRGNWIQTDPNKGWNTDPAPLQPTRAILYKEMAAE